MNDKQSPLEIHPDEHLEARITAYVLGDASPFEAAEIEELISKSPELKLFANRTRTLHGLLKEAETTSNSPDSEWKLSGKRRIALAPAIGPVPVLAPRREKFIRRASFRAAFGIAAVFLITLFISPMVIRQKKKVDIAGGSKLEMDVPMPTAIDATYNRAEESGVSFHNDSRRDDALPQIRGAIVDESRAESKWKYLKRNLDTNHLSDAKEDFERDITETEALKLQLTDGEVSESVTEEKMELAKRDPAATPMPKPSVVPIPVEEAPDSSLAFGDGDDFGGGSGGGGAVEGGRRDETLAMKERISRSAGADFNSPVGGATIPGIPTGEGEVSNIVTSGLRSGDQAIARNSIDAILNNPDRNARADNSKGLSSLTGTFSDETANGIMENLAKPTSRPSAAADPESSLALGGQDARHRDSGLRPGMSGKDSGKLGAVAGEKTKETAQAMERMEKQLEQVHELPDMEKREEAKALGERRMQLEITKAREMRKLGKYDEARDILEKAEDSAPDDALIKKEIAYLDDPIRTSPALTNEHQKNIDEVRRKLYMAEGNLDLGKFDDAKKNYEETLRIDPDNSAARRGMEKIANAKSDYYRAAYDQTRSELNMQVDKAWELSVPGEADKPEDVSGYGWFSHSAGKKAEVLDGRQIAGDVLDADAPVITEETRYKMDVHAGAERGEADETTSLTGLFSGKGEKEWKGKAGTNPGYLFRGVDLSGSDHFDRDAELDLYAENSDRSLYYDSQGQLPNGFTNFESRNTGGTLELDFSLTDSKTEFEGFIGYGAPIQIEGNTKTSDRVLRREVPPVPNFFPTPDPGTVTSRSGATADIDVIREFIYPTEFERPELDGEDTIEKEPSIVTPATPVIDPAQAEDEVPILGDIPLIGRLFSREQPTDITGSVLERMAEKKPIDLADLSNEIPAAQEPFSTFSLNVSDASFQVASTAVEKGERPDPGSIKPEQFYNGVSYDDPAPSTGEPVAAAIGQVAHPVIPGRNLVRMSVRTASTGRAASQPLVLTLLVDQSGSMARADRRAAMDTALTQLATLMNPDDRITVIGFSRTPRLLADSLSGDDAGKLPDIINQASSEGGTNIEQALNLAENLALRHKLGGAQNRIVLFTDGAANLGNADPERLAERVKKLRQQDLAFDIAGIGTNDINDQLLSELSRHGNGRYYLVGENTGGNLAKQLAGAFRPAAENVKIQVKFNPQRVGNYKLIGFEKDRLKTEDFRNDSVDAAELAADESGTALYQVEPLPDGSGEIGELYVRFRDTATGEMVERSWTIPYESQAPAIDRAQPSMQLAALSLLAAQKLQPGPLADAINFRDLAPTIANVKQAYSRSPQAQQMVTLINALK